MLLDEEEDVFVADVVVADDDVVSPCPQPETSREKTAREIDIYFVFIILLLLILAF